MKKTNIILCLGFTALLFTACSKESELIEPISVTDQVEKIETSYEPGCVKEETLFKEGDIKIETKASDEYIESLIAQYETRTIKNKTSKGLYNIGVLKSGSCPFGGIRIIMDNQDRNNDSHTNGWVGDSHTRYSRNLWLELCIFDIRDFQPHSQYDYAVVKLSSYQPADNYISEIIRYFDNEDDSNSNAAYFVYSNGSLMNIKSTNFYDPLRVDGNTKMAFYYFVNKNGGMTNFPTQHYPSSYGVFGDLDDNGLGYIYTDDEDNRNANWLKINGNTININGTYTVESDLRRSSSHYKNPILQASENTKLYVTEIKNGIPQPN